MKYKSTEWFNLKTEYKGMPLYFRKPDIENIFKLKNEYNLLLLINTNTINNSTLDNDIITLFDSKKEGYIFFIETFNGERNYYFYNNKTKALEKKYTDINFQIMIKNDPDYNFIKEYSFNIY